MFVNYHTNIIINPDTIDQSPEVTTEGEGDLTVKLIGYGTSLLRVNTN